MKVKIDTREKFHVITIQEPVLAANMTEKMDKVLLPLLESNIKSAIVKTGDIQTLDNAAAAHFIKLQHQFYNASASFVVCELSTEIRKNLDKAGLLEQLNYTPTESEAMDIVQMEEIERELDA